MAVSFGCFRQSFLESLSNERFCERGRAFLFPFLQPGADSSSELARAFGEKMLGQFCGATLQVTLAHFNHRQQFVSFALPSRLLILAPKSLAEILNLALSSFPSEPRVRGDRGHFWPGKSRS